MVESFSAGYYLLRLYIEPHEGDRAVINSVDHSDLLDEVYGDADIRPQQPLLVKLDESHLPVLPGRDIPSGILAVPGPVLEETRIDTPPTLREVLLAKGERADRLIDLFTPVTAQTWSPS